MLNKNIIINFKKYIIQFIQIILGTAITAISIQLFLLPNKISVGGFSGLATITYYLFNAQVGTVVFLLNVPLFIIALFQNGKNFFVNSILGTTALSFFLNLFHNFNVWTEDILLACIYGGVLSGIGTAIVLKANASTGGTELLTRIIRNYKPNIKTSNLIVILDTIIIGLSVIVFKNIEIGLYSALSIYITGKILDVFVEGIDFAKMIFIISDKYNEIAEDINNKIERGITALYGRGMYKKDDKIILLCVVSRREVNQIRKIVNDIDKRCFCNNIKRKRGIWRRV